MLSQIRRVGLAVSALVVAVIAVATYAVLTTVAGSADSNAPAVVSATANTAQTQDVGGVSIVNGKVRYSGGIKAPAHKSQAGRRTRPARTAASHQAVAPSEPRAASASGLAQQLGQMIVSPVAGTTADSGLLANVRSGHIGGVILFGANIRTRAQVAQLVSTLQRTARAGGHPGLLVMTDQEGGDVKRFASAPPSMSARTMGTLGPASSEQQGQATGAALLKVGVNVDLAPVSDVPVSDANFLGPRAFSKDAATVASDACAFSAGLHGGGVVSALKHFPGLGKASGNTDDGPVHIQAGASELTPDLRPYRQCADTPRTLVMVSNASYSGLTGDQPAVASPATYALLRDTLGFHGATISDSLDAGAVTGVSGLAVTAANAGLDIGLWTSTSSAQAAYTALLSAVRSGSLPRARVRSAASRVLQLKASLGLS